MRHGVRISWNIQGRFTSKQTYYNGKLHGEFLEEGGGGKFIVTLYDRGLIIQKGRLNSKVVIDSNGKYIGKM